MIYKPHNYQKYAIEFIKEHPIAAILLDMGMGKTSIVCSALNDLMYDSFEVSKVLIIAPLRVARNTWSDEIEKWDHLKGLRYSIVVGTAAERKKALEADADIFIINRENVPWLVDKSGYPFDYDMIVVDELSSFKNWNAVRFKALMKVRPKVKRIVGLTGSPASSGLMDLFGEIKVLDMGERLGRFISQYRTNYFKPDRMNGPIVYTYKLLPGAEDRIYDKISDITISMKGTDYLEMYCDEHKQLHKNDRAYARERGYGAKWQRERRKYLDSNPFCVKCYEEGHITMATVVDHIKPHRGDQKLFWNRGNWQPLCEHHHNVKTMTEDRYVEYKF